MTAAAALTYAGLAAIVVGFQLALVAGAPWGHLTMGGFHTGRLTHGRRALALASALLLSGMAWAVLARAGIAPGPAWAIWPALALTALTTAANLLTPSAAERRLWGPVTVAMLAAALVVASA